jgi:dTDP-4-dehydrorhamnose reductase
MKKLLLIGKNGQVGNDLSSTLSSFANIVAVDQDTFDLTDPASFVSFIRELKPSVIVNAAAYTAVDKAETELELAMAINGTAPGILAEEAKKLDALLVHYSTDYVFDGSSPNPYQEGDKTNPLNVYGKSKRAGEVAIENVGGKYFTFRTSWVYGLFGKNFLLTMLQLAREREELRIVNDQIGAPTWSQRIAEVTRQVLDLSELHPQWGLYHMTAQDKTSWCGFAQAIFDKEFVIKKPRVLPITSEEYPTPALRPKNSLLNNDKLFNAFGIRLDSWDHALAECCQSLLK